LGTSTPKEIEVIWESWGGGSEKPLKAWFFRIRVEGVKNHQKAVCEKNEGRKMASKNKKRGRKDE